jgi:hypothetical protein
VPLLCCFVVFFRCFVLFVVLWFCGCIFCVGSFVFASLLHSLPFLYFRHARLLNADSLGERCWLSAHGELEELESVACLTAWQETQSKACSVFVVEGSEPACSN